MGDKQSELTSMTPEELVEGFLREAKLEESAMETPGVSASVMNAHGERSRLYAAEIKRRGGLPSLAPLLDSPDSYIAYSVAAQLAGLANFREAALVALDRVADARSGSASASANIGRNMIRFGQPSRPRTLSGEAE